MRQLIDNQVIARWSHQPAPQPAPSTITLYSSGKVNSPAGNHTWSFTNGRLTLRWKAPQAPGGYWLDTCLVSSDGLSYHGANQQNVKIVGTLLKAE